MQKVKFYISDLGEGGAQIITLQHAKILRDMGYSVEIIILSDKKITIEIDVPHKIISNRFPKFIRIIKQAYEVKKIDRAEHPINICVMEYAGMIGWLADIKFKQVFHSDIHYKYSGAKKMMLNFMLKTRKISTIFVSNALIREGIWSVIKPKTKILQNLYQSVIPVSSYRDAEKYIVFIGRLVSVKDPLELIQVYYESKLVSRYKLIIVGDGGLRAEIENYILEKEIADRVHITGWINNPNYYLKNAYLMIASSHSEAAPNAVIDAFTMGVPVFVTKNNSGYKALIGGERGYVCGSTTVKAKGEELKNYLHNDLLRDKHIENARSYVDELKSIDKYGYIDNMLIKEGL